VKSKRIHQPKSTDTMTEQRLLVLNLGSTSTKLAVFNGPDCLFTETIRHAADELKPFKTIADQHDFRKAAVLERLRTHGVDPRTLTAIVSRGGLLKPVPAGVYAIGRELVADARSGRYGQHACSVGCEIAFNLATELGIPALMVDPPICDDMCDEARYTGLPQITRRPVWHALNQRAIARRLAADLDKPHDELHAVIAHLGGGISIGAHAGGRVIDVNNCLDGDGPFSPERAGSLPTGSLVSMCFSGSCTKDEVFRLLAGRGGLFAHLGTIDGEEIESRIRGGDVKAQKTVEAMAYQVAKAIGAAACALGGRIDAIALTGGLAHWSRLVELISDRVRFIAPVRLYPGEDEIGALAAGALRALAGEETVQQYG
jgi:butyrate kinase